MLCRSWRRNQSTIIVVGSDSRALAFARKIRSRPELGYTFEGFVDDSAMSSEIGTTQYPLLADLEGLEALLWQKAVDAVVVALPVKPSDARAARIAAVCEDQGIAVWFLSDPPRAHSTRTKTKRVAGEKIVVMPTAGVVNPGSCAVKQVTDTVASFILLLALSPLFLVVALLIKATSPGPVFFAQERVGIRKHPFRLYKFRTMFPDAEQKMHEVEELNEVEGPVFKIRNDPRITRLGRFLRRTSIDELPQLFNVLKGEMSLVGPRPLSIRDYKGIDQNWHRHRFKVRPGMTCLWQVNGRSNVPFDHWMKLDIEYVDNWSLALDLKILFKTVPAVLKGSGAA